MQIEVDYVPTPRLLDVEVFNGGIYALHNYPCTVCRERHAVLDLSCGVMKPCGRCQGEGYSVVRAQGFKRKVLQWLGLVR